MEFNNIAKPYAKAILKVALEDDNISAWSDMLNIAAKLIIDTKLNKLIVSPKISSKDKANIIINLLNRSLLLRASKEQVALINLLAKNNRMLALPAIYYLFSKQSEAVRGLKSLIVISPYELSKQQILELKTKLSANYSVNVSLQVMIDKNLLGGIIIKDGDRVMNYSIKAKLEKLDTLLAVN